MPESFENLSMTCKSIYIKSSNLRTKHNKLRKRYRHFSYDLYVSSNEEADGEDNVTTEEQVAQQLEHCYSSLQLLLRIADEPLIARYMVTADFKHDTVPRNHRFTDAVAQQARKSENLLTLIGDSAYFYHAGFEPTEILDHFVQKFRPQDGTSGIAATFLLTLLPNVTTLALPENWGTYDWHNPDVFWKRKYALEDLVERANDPKYLAAGLSKLTSILPSAAWGYDARWPLETFNPFLSIKSVTSFIAGGCVAVDDGYTGCPFPDPSDENYGINIEEVTLAGSVVDEKELQTFLRRLPKLKHLKISYETKWHGCGHDMDAGGILAAIESTTANTLESLTFAVYTCYGDISIVTSLKGFTKLKDLELDSLILMEVDRATDVSRLADLVPASVEKFTLLVEKTRDYQPMLNQLFKDVSTDIEKKLPNLKDIVIRFRGENLEVSDMLEFSTQEINEADPSVAPWRKELATLKNLLSVRTVTVPIDTASFMEGFCEKYGVVPE